MKCICENVKNCAISICLHRQEHSTSEALRSCLDTPCQAFPNSSFCCVPLPQNSKEKIEELLKKIGYRRKDKSEI